MTYISATDIADEIEARLLRITVANGFATDIGNRVLLGRLNLDEKELPCTVLVEGEDRVREQNRSGIAHITQPYVAEGHIECDIDRPNDGAHQVLKDIKRAIFGTPFVIAGRELPIRYTGRAIGQRAAGSKFTAASVRFEVEYAENLREP